MWSGPADISCHRQTLVVDGRQGVVQFKTHTYIHSAIISGVTNHKSLSSFFKWYYSGCHDVYDFEFSLTF